MEDYFTRFLAHCKALLDVYHKGEVTYEDWRPTAGLVSSAGMLSLKSLRKGFELFCEWHRQTSAESGVAVKPLVAIDDAHMVSLLGAAGFKMTPKKSIVSGLVQLPQPKRLEVDENVVDMYLRQKELKMVWHHMHPIHQYMQKRFPKHPIHHRLAKRWAKRQALVTPPAKRQRVL